MLKRLVPQGGFEPSTYRLRSDCSAVELLRRPQDGPSSKEGGRCRSGTDAYCHSACSCEVIGPRTRSLLVLADEISHARGLLPPPPAGEGGGGGRLARINVVAFPLPVRRWGTSESYDLNSARMRLQLSGGGDGDDSVSGSSGFSPLGPGSSGACTSGLAPGATGVMSARAARDSLTIAAARARRSLLPPAKKGLRESSSPLRCACSSSALGGRVSGSSAGRAGSSLSAGKRSTRDSPARCARSFSPSTGRAACCDGSAGPSPDTLRAEAMAAPACGVSIVAGTDAGTSARCSITVPWSSPASGSFHSNASSRPPTGGIGNQ